MEQTATQLEGELEVKEALDENLEYVVDETIETEGIRSESGKQIYKKNIPDKEEYIKRKETALRKLHEEEEVQKAIQLENTAKEIDDMIKEMFVVGDYQNHYSVFERIKVGLSSKISPSLEKRVTTSVNNSVSVWLTKAAMKNLQTDISKYESLAREAERRESYYEREKEDVEDRVTHYKCEMEKYNKSGEDAALKLKELNRDKIAAIEGGELATAHKLKTEIQLLKSDKKKFFRQRDNFASMIGTECNKLARKKFGLVGSYSTRDEYGYILQELRNVYEDVRDMLQDHRKYGTPIAISEGRLLVSRVHDINDKRTSIDERTAEFLREVGQMRRDVPSRASDLKDASKDLGDEMARTNNERYLQALKLSEQVLSEQMGA